MSERKEKALFLKLCHSLLLACDRVFLEPLLLVCDQVFLEPLLLVGDWGCLTSFPVPQALPVHPLEGSCVRSSCYSGDLQILGFTIPMGLGGYGRACLTPFLPLVFRSLPPENAAITRDT